MYALLVTPPQYVCEYLTNSFQFGMLDIVRKSAEHVGFTWHGPRCCQEWWCSVLLGTIVMRVFLLPVALRMQHSKAKMALARDDIQVGQHRIASERAGRQASRPGPAGRLASQPASQALQRRYGTSPRRSREAAASLEMEMGALYTRRGIHPLSMLAPVLVQGPVFMSMILALRRISDLGPGAAMGGTLWFTDLAATDPTYALPLLTGVTMAAQASTQRANQPDGSAARQLGPGLPGSGADGRAACPVMQPSQRVSQPLPPEIAAVEFGMRTNTGEINVQMEVAKGVIRSGNRTAQ